MPECSVAQQLGDVITVPVTASAVGRRGPLVLVVLGLLDVLENFAGFGMFFLLVGYMDVAEASVRTPVTITVPTPLVPVSGIGAGGWSPGALGVPPGVATFITLPKSPSLQEGSRDEFVGACAKAMDFKTAVCSLRDNVDTSFTPGDLEDNSSRARAGARDVGTRGAPDVGTRMGCPFTSFASSHSPLTATWVARPPVPRGDPGLCVVFRVKRVATVTTRPSNP